MTPITSSLLNRRRFVGMSAALSAALAMGAPRFAGTVSAQAAEQMLRIACEEPETFDTGTIGGGIGIQWANHLFEGLTRYDWQNQQVVPGAAASWDISADSLTYTFHLNPGMLWSDGSPVVAGDFEYAMKRNLEPGLAGPLATFLYPLKGAEEYFTGATTDPATVAITAKDDLTLEMTLDRGHALLVDHALALDLRPDQQEVDRRRRIAVDRTGDDHQQRPLQDGIVGTRPEHGPRLRTRTTTARNRASPGSSTPSSRIRPSRG